MNYLKYLLNNKAIILELVLIFRVLLNNLLLMILWNDWNFSLSEEDNIEVEYTDIDNRPPSPGCGEWNLIDTNSFYDYWLSLINKIQNLDIDSQIVIFSILLLIICFIYILYIFFFVISPSLFDAIKNILPLKLKHFMVKFININRALSVPFIILSFLLLLFCLLLAIFLLTIMVYLNNLNP
jgi:hypothetical protein